MKLKLVMRMQHRSWAWRALCVWMLAVAFGALPVQAAERLAQGLIVKMKESQPDTVVRFRALAKPHGSSSELRLRLSAAAQRSRVSFVQHRATAFGAMVVSKGQLMSLAEAQAEAARMRQDPDVAWVVVNEVHQPAAYAFNDPRRGQQSWMQDSTTGGSPNIPAAFARMEGRTLSEVVVAVLDTGILPHPDFEGRIYLEGTANPGGYDFVSEQLLANDDSGLDRDASDPGDYLTQAQLNANASTYVRLCAPEVPEAKDSTWHGTTTAGILAAAGNNNIGFTGLLAPLPGVPVLPVRVSGVCGAALSDIIEGMLWSAGVDYFGSPPANPHPARIISLSFGSSQVGCGCTSNHFNGADSVACLYREAVAALKAKGALLVASAGNDGQSDASMPASCPGVLGVTAVRRSDGLRASYANAVLNRPSVSRYGLATMGGDVDVQANDLILTTWNGGDTTALSYEVPRTKDYAESQGTSMATPMAAGAAALMLAVNPGLTVDELLTGLTQHGVKANSADLCSACGAGVLDVDKAVAWAISVPAKPFQSADVYAGFFTPSRSTGGTQQKPSGGGGGADPALLALLLVAGMLGVAGRLKAGKPQTPCLRAGAGR
jgi:serine protease